MIKKNLLIAGAMLLIMTAFSVNKAQAQTCVMPPSCEDLGYTMTEVNCVNADMVLKCPTDLSKVFCEEKIIKTCDTVGDILYGDGTCAVSASKLVSNLTPIGVVFDVDNRLAVALTDVKQDGSAGSETMDWSENYCDIPDLWNCTRKNAMNCETNGESNTEIILESTCSGPTYAANATYNYEVSGKWFLPSMRELYTIYSNKSVINNTLTLLSSVGARQLLEEDFYWSSNEDSENNAWSFRMSDGIAGSGNKFYDYYVRPVVAF